MFSVSKRPTIAEIQELYRLDKATPTQMVQFFLNRSQQLDKKIQAVYQYTEEEADNLAIELEKMIVEYKAKNSKSDWFEKLLADKPLFGIPFMLKANVFLENYVFNSGSKIMDGFKAPYSSTVYLKLKQAGAVVIAICNMDEFATGSSGEHCFYGTTKNPFDTDRVPGGSSSGPTAAVGSGQTVFAIGTDTGGSCRQPGAFCDVVALKPTYGLISRYGIAPMASSLDQAGALTNTVEDNLIVTKIISGKDKMDQTTIASEKLVQDLEKVLENKKNGRKAKNPTKTTKSLRIGLPKEFYIDGIDPQIRGIIENLHKKLTALGHTLVDVSVPLSKYAISVYYMTMPVEFASNLERIDGVRYATQQDSYQTPYYEHRGKYFGEEPIRRIMLGTYASSAGYFDAYYNHAEKVRELTRRSFEEIFKDVDVLLTPTTPEFPFKVGEKTSDPLKMYLSDVFTCGINPVRIPGLAVPLGLFPVALGEPTTYEEVTVSINAETGEEVTDTLVLTKEPETVMLPTGCQLLGPELSENVLYQLAEEIESIVGPRG